MSGYINKICLAGLFVLSASFSAVAAERIAEERTQEANQETLAETGPSYLLPQYTVYGSMMPVEIAKYPGSVSVLESDDLGTYNTIIRNLEKVPGFNTGYSVGRSISQDYTIRGYSGDRVIIKLDNVPREAGMGFTSSFRVDPTILKSVEVVKGASSILHGGGAIGGVVAMTTKDPSDYITGDKPYALELNTRFETNDMFSQAVTGAIKTDTLPIDLLLHFRFVKEGDIELAGGGGGDYYYGETLDEAVNDSGIKSFLGKVGWDLTEGQRLELSLSHYQQDTTTTVNPSFNMNYDPELRFSSPPTDFSLKQTDLVGTYEWDSTSTDLIDLTVMGYYASASNHRYMHAQLPDVPNDATMINSEHRWGFTAKNIAAFNTGSVVKHSLVAGVDYHHRSEDYHFIYGTDTAWGVGVDQGMPNNYSDLGIYLQDDITFFDIFTLTLGGRYDSYYRKVEGHNSSTEGRFSPRIGAALEVFDGFYLLGNYSETFRAPTPMETNASGYLNQVAYYIPNPNLEPETAKEFEFGLSYNKTGLFTDNDSLFFKGMYFVGEIENLIEFEYLTDLGDPPPHGALDPDYYGQYRNVSNAKREGFEIEARYGIASWLFMASYEHLKLYDADTGQDINDYADKLRVGVAYTYEPFDLTVGVDVDHWFAANPAPYTGSNTVYYYPDESFTIVNALVTWKPSDLGWTFFNDNLEIGLGVNNIFDDTYSPPNNLLNANRLFYGTGRNIYGTFKLTF